MRCARHCLSYRRSRNEAAEEETEEDLEEEEDSEEEAVAAEEDTAEEVEVEVDAVEEVVEVDRVATGEDVKKMKQEKKKKKKRKEKESNMQALLASIEAFPEELSEVFPQPYRLLSVGGSELDVQVGVACRVAPCVVPVVPRVTVSGNDELSSASPVVEAVRFGRASLFWELLWVLLRRPLAGPTRRREGPN